MSAAAESLSDASPDMEDESARLAVSISPRLGVNGLRA